MAITVRLISSPGNVFVLQTSTYARDGLGEQLLPFSSSGSFQEGIYEFGRFQALGTPDWSSINAIEFELQGGSIMGRLGNIQFVTLPERVPEPSSLLLLGTGLAGLVVASRRRSAKRT